MSHPDTGTPPVSQGVSQPSSATQLRQRSPDSSPQDRELSVVRQVAVPFLARLMTDISTQIWFPFLPLMARGMGMTVPQLSVLLGIRNMCGGLAPVWGALADRFGYLKFLRLEILASIAGLLLLTLTPTPEMRSIGVIIAGIATLAFVPTMVAWLSTRVPYQQRGRALGMLEYSWAVSGIAGVPLVGVLLENYSWKTPFWILIGGFLVAYLLFQRVSATPIATGHGSAPRIPTAQWNIADQLLSLRNLIATVPVLAWVVMGFGFLVMVTLYDFLFVFAGWLTDTFGLTPLQLSGVVLGMGVADLSGSVAVSLFTDRLGKVRSLQLGGIVVMVACSLLPLTGFHLVATLANLVLFRCGIEFLIVSTLAYASEVMPKRPGFMMSILSAGMFSGSGVSGVLGPALFRMGGITAIGLSSIFLIGICTATCRLWFPELGAKTESGT